MVAIGLDWISLHGHGIAQNGTDWEPEKCGGRSQGQSFSMQIPSILA